MKPISAFVPGGSGSSIVHRALARDLSGYRLYEYDRRLEYCPFALPILARREVEPNAIIHTTADHGCFLRRSGHPLVITFHNFFLDAFMRTYSTRMQRWHYASDLRWWINRGLREADAVTAVSAFTASLVKRELNFQAPIEVIPNGVDTERFRPAARHDGERITVLFSGNPTRRKGGDLLPQIAAHLHSGIEIIYTQGLSASRALATVANLRSLGRIRWEEMPAVYRQSDIVLAPAVREGMSLAILEAMASGLPVVTSDASSMPELIKQGRGGYLCPLNDVKALAAAVNKLASSASLREDMGAYNRERVERHFSLGAMLAAYRRVFEKF